VLADFAWDATNKRLGVGTSTPGALAHFNSTVAGTKALIVRGTTTSASQDYFDVVLTDPTGGGGSAMRVMGGATGINPLFQVDRAGDTQFSGWLRALSTSGLVTNGADYFALTLGNGAGGNLGLFAGLSNPTFSTFGSYGSIYMNGSSPGLPYYNNNGTTGWDRLVGESATQTLSNKTLTSPTITGTPSITGYLPIGGGTLTGALTGTTGLFDITFDDGKILGVSGATKGIRIGTDTTGGRIEGVDATLVGSFQPLYLGGSAVQIGAALTGTTATFSGTVMAPGAQIQMVSVETGAVATGTGIIPTDDTIPQITEGDQYMTLAITPKSATSKLIIEVVFAGSLSIGAQAALIVALFQDATANALAANWAASPAAAVPMAPVVIRHVMTSGTTSATTFRVRAGLQAAGTLTFNGVAAARFLGGVMASSIVIREVAP
jgi:hypothetical protein